MSKNQEIFDKVSQHLIKQNRQCALFDESGAMYECLYRDANGLACAIGCLIPEDKYHPNMEGNGGIGGNIFVDLVIEELYGSDVDFPFLRSLQYIHDSFNPSDWKEKFTQYALDHGLTVGPWLKD